MAARMFQEMQGVEGGVQTVLVRIPIEQSALTSGGVEVTVLVRVPAVDSNAQVEAAAREMARQTLQTALAQFP